MSNEINADGQIAREVENFYRDDRPEWPESLSELPAYLRWMVENKKSADRDLLESVAQLAEDEAAVTHKALVELRTALDLANGTAIANLRRAEVAERLIAEMHTAFTQYREAAYYQSNAIARRGSSFGIAVSSDTVALRYQALCETVERARAIIEGRDPIAAAWNSTPWFKKQDTI